MRIGYPMRTQKKKKKKKNYNYQGSTPRLLVDTKILTAVFSTLRLGLTKSPSPEFSRLKLGFRGAPVPTAKGTVLNLPEDPLTWSFLIL